MVQQLQSKCEKCNKSFRDAFTLKRHKKSRLHKEGYIKHICVICRPGIPYCDRPTFLYHMQSKKHKRLGKRSKQMSA